uniref:VPS10 domain-containing protein n=1 Tax=Phaeomonas parva TaxID=124430 RepID=A0A7S1UBX7_9STRA|mmetsp:Transcript_4047/g.11818  ORF Transcript_4047/g.11818 Transcript_4047/m.11818 type:complete len:484 (+) Transcript_4047:278-1729(+)
MRATPLLQVLTFACAGGEVALSVSPLPLIPARVEHCSGNVSAFFSTVASSAEGSRVVAARYDDQVWISDDYGRGWRAVSFRGLRSGARLVKVAVDSGGQRIAVMRRNGVGMFLSLDGGETWRDARRHGGIIGRAISGDGWTIAAAGQRDNALWLSQDFGATFSAVTDSTQAGLIQDVALSPDGSTIAVVRRFVQAHARGVDTGSTVWVSADHGVTWRPSFSEEGAMVSRARVSTDEDGNAIICVIGARTTEIGEENSATTTELSCSRDLGWTWESSVVTKLRATILGFAVSSDGQQITVLLRDQYRYDSGSDPVRMLLSDNGGATWYASNFDSGAGFTWSAMSSASSGRRLVVVGREKEDNTGVVVISADGAASWHQGGECETAVGADYYIWMLTLPVAMLVALLGCCVAFYKRDGWTHLFCPGWLVHGVIRTKVLQGIPADDIEQAEATIPHVIAVDVRDVSAEGQEEAARGAACKSARHPA